MEKHVSTYLLFDGNCKQALEFYHQIFDGEINMQTAGESPMAKQFPENMHSRIINGNIKGKNLQLSASDWMMPSEKPERGNMNCLYVTGNSAAKTKEIFDTLSEKGKITDPLTKQPFGLYGRLIDQFGVIWMFHSDSK